MHIKQLIISGFRSFRNQNDEDIIPFSSKHNVIVGRNGSGKSNFFNAIQFVLVAPRFATLSQEDRQHLLHEGAGASVISAYVEITFDNSDGRFPVETEEVILRRTIGLKKDEFFLNRKRIQKNEVINLLESAGFSKSNPYYIVQQGKVANLCVMKDRDRLNLLKEIAGTSVYEERRAESVKIIADTVSKQERIEENLTSMEERLGELEKEKEELTEFDSLEKRRRALQYTIYNIELVKSNKKYESVDSQRTQHTAQQQLLYASLRSLQDQIANEEDHLRVARQGLDRLQNRRESWSKEGKTIHHKRSKLLLEIEEVESAQQEKLIALEELKGQLTAIEDSIVQQENLLAIEEPIYQQSHEELLKKQNELISSRSRIETLYGKQGRGKQFRTKNERNDFLGAQITSLREQMGNKTAALNKFLHEIGELKKELQGQHQRNELIKGSCKELSEQIDNLQRSLTELLDQRNQLQESRKSTWQELDVVQEEIQKCQNELEKNKQHLNSLIPRQVSIGLSSVERIVEEMGIGRDLNGNRRAGVYLGPLIDNITLKDEGFSTAVEVAAGNSLFHVIVDTDETAARLMKELEKRKAGRLTFLPLNQLRLDPVHYPESNDVRPLIKAAINYDSNLENAVKHVFGRKLLAKDLETAAKFSKEFQLDAVTHEGDLVNRKGGFEGGYRDERASTITLVQKIKYGCELLSKYQEKEKEIEQKSQLLDSEVNEILSKIQRMETEKNHMKTNHTQMTRELGNRVRQYELGEENRVKREGMIESTQRELESLSNQINDYENEMRTELNTALTPEEREELNRLTSRCQILEGEVLNTESKVVELSTQREGRKAILRDNLLKRKAEINDSLMELGEVSELRRASSLSTTSDMDDEINPLRADLELIEKNMRDVDERLLSLDKNLNDQKDQVLTLELHVEELKQRENNQENEIMEMTKLLDKLLNERNLLLEIIKQKQELIRDLGSLPKKEIDELRESSEKVLLMELKSTNEKLKQYSGVNRKALEQYVNFNEQRQSLVDRKNEILKEKEAIEHLIHSLDLQKENAILTTFETVNQHFQTVFQELVRGGHGELVMITDINNEEDNEEDDQGSGSGSGGGQNVEKKTTTGPAKIPKSSYRGIQIHVSFSESSQQFEMNQLSGGQKALVALALIFAIQRCDPAPFYLFDEIDQALDANYRTEVARIISQQVNNEDNPTQFITTTFRPEMVHVASQCYGIALQNKSSKILSITKNEAQQFVTDLMTEEENVTSVVDYPPLGHRHEDKEREDDKEEGKRRRISERSVDTFATNQFSFDEKSVLDDEIEDNDNDRDHGKEKKGTRGKQENQQSSLSRQATKTTTSGGRKGMTAPTTTTPTTKGGVAGNDEMIPLTEEDAGSGDEETKEMVPRRSTRRVR